METDLKKLTLLERLRVPNYFNVRDVSTGEIIIDTAECIGCGICVTICPAGGLAMSSDNTKKMPVMRRAGNGVTLCIACGDCMAACPEVAISIERGYNTKKYFKKLSQTEKFTYPKLY